MIYTSATPVILFLIAIIRTLEFFNLRKRAFVLLLELQFGIGCFRVVLSFDFSVFFRL